MAYDEKLAERIEAIIPDELEPKKMFGGVVYMLGKKMCVGIHKNELIVRVGEEQAEVLLERPFVRSMDLTGRPMRGWLQVSPEGVKAKEDMIVFIDSAIKYVKTL